MIALIAGDTMKLPRSNTEKSLKFKNPPITLPLFHQKWVDGDIIMVCKKIMGPI
jgi:hypothetical protein